MTYITRNANLILLFLIGLVATSLVGATVYFQSTFDDINREYNDKLAQLNNVSSQLEQYRGILATAKEELQLKLAREEEFASKFTEVRTTAEQLEQDKTRLLTDKKNLQSELQSLTTQVTQAKSELASVQTQLTSTKSQLTSAQADLAAANRRISSYRDEVDCLKAKSDAEESTC